MPRGSDGAVQRALNSELRDNYFSACTQKNYCHVICILIFIPYNLAYKGAPLYASWSPFSCFRTYILVNNVRCRSQGIVVNKLHREDISILRDTAAIHLKHAQPYCSNDENLTAMVLSSSFRRARIIDKVIARCGTEIRTIERLHRPTGYDSLMLLFCLWKWAPFLTSASNGGA